MYILTMGELRSLLEDFTTANGLEVIPRSRVVNEVDREQFNYSIEEPILRRFGSYLAFDAPWSFAVIQPFARPTDFSLLVRGEATRQSVFDVGAVRFSLDPDTNHRRTLHTLALTEMVRFLTEEVGLDPDQLSFTYYGGGSLVDAAEASGRKLNLADKSLSFPPDTVTREVLKGLGLGGNQIIAETSLDTFLAEFPAPIEFWAGYRYEVFYTDPDTQERIEIGTGERLEYRRLVWEAERIRGSMTGLAVTKDIVPHPGCFAACGIGLERVLTVTNGLATPYECDHIAPVYDMTLSKARVRDEQAARVLTDALRTLHLVVADGFGFDSLPSRHLKNAYGKYCCELDRCARMLGVDDTALGELCAVNAAAQPWYEELAEATPRVLQELAAYRRRVASAGGGTDGR